MEEAASSASSIPAEADSASAFSVSGEIINAILTHGSGVSEGKLRIFEQYALGQSEKENAVFLKEEYGIGGTYPALTVDGQDVSEDHDGSGIRLRVGMSGPARKITWTEAARRIGKLIADGRYLNEQERVAYAGYLSAKAEQAKRSAVADQFRSLVREYAADHDALNRYVLSDCADAFTTGRKTTWTLTQGNWILPLMRSALQQIVADGTPEQRQTAIDLLKVLQRPEAAALEPSEEELHPSIPIYKISVQPGDSVWLNGRERQIVSVTGEEKVSLADPDFPLFTEDLLWDDFRREMLADCRNNPFTVILEHREMTQAEIDDAICKWNGSEQSKGNVIRYGTSRMDAYEILERTLNMREVRIYDVVHDRDGEHRIPNPKETTIAQQKQQSLQDAFQEWIWEDPERRQRLTALYNERFNAIRPREYDGSHLRFIGANPEISLRPHQLGAIAHIIYGGNTLLAHVVGAGKTYEMIASIMESKRLGLCKKAMIAVPNHLTEQWGSEFMTLYPAANILVAREKDFAKENRRKLFARIATGDYDAIIVGHSQFERIPVSLERQRAWIQSEIDAVTDGLRELKFSRSERFSVKQLERMKKNLESRLEKLSAQERKDDFLTFEELGVDRLYVDEAQAYKNLFCPTKMTRVAGLSTAESQRSADMLCKCRYLDELTGSRGVVFATGTPVSNSMVELYTMQRYLQNDRLRELGFTTFDSWASTFGETVTAMELAPEGYTLVGR